MHKRWKSLRLFWLKNQYITNMLILFVIIGVFGVTQSTNAQETTVLKLEQAITLALNADNDVKVAGNDLTKAQLAVELAKINTLPSAATSARVNDYFGEASSNQNYQLKVEQTLPTKWHLYGADQATTTETKRWEVTKGTEALRLARAETVNDTTALYLSALKAEQTLEYQQAAVEYAREKAAYNQQQLLLGKVTKTTQLTAANEYAKARYELIKDQQTYQLAIKKLTSQIGIDAKRAVVLDRTLLDAKPVRIEYEKQKPAAMKERPEIQQYRMELKTAVQALAVAKNGGLPTLNLSYQNRGELQSYDAKYDFLNGEFSWSTAWQKSYSKDDDSMENFYSQDMFGSKRKRIGLTLVWDLDFGSAAKETKQARYAVDSAQRNLEQSSRDIALEIDAAIADYESAQAALEYNRSGIPLYEKTLELSQLQSRLGMLPAIDLKKAELDLESAQTDVATATCDLLIAAQKLKLVLGLLYDLQ